MNSTASFNGPASDFGCFSEESGIYYCTFIQKINVFNVQNVRALECLILNQFSCVLSLNCVVLNPINFKKIRNFLPMKIEIKIEADNDSMEKIQNQFKTISAGIGNVVKFFEQFEMNLKSEETGESTPLEAEVVDIVKDENHDIITEENVSEKEGASDVKADTATPVVDSSMDVDVSAPVESVKALDKEVAKPPVVPPTSPKKKSAAVKKSVKASPKKKTKQAGAAPASKKLKSKVKKKTVVRKPRVTAGATVLKHIQKSETGLDSKVIEKKTGFGAKKVADTVYQLKKKGLVEKTEQGLFVAI